MATTKASTEASMEEQTKIMLAQLLSECGIKDSFINFSGEIQFIPQSELLAVLAAQGIDVSGNDSQPELMRINKHLAALRLARNSALLPPVVVFSRQSELDECTITLNIPEIFLSGKVRWYTVSENKTRSVTVEMDLSQLKEVLRQNLAGTDYCQLELPLELTDLPLGYHQLSVSISTPASADDNSAGHEKVENIPLVIAPARCFEPAWSAEGRKLWGFSVQLYSFCTMRSWGMGDFLDLACLIKKSAAQGASYLILNPLHAGPLNKPQHCSPYSPVDRRRLNPLYIAPELEPEFVTGRASSWLANNKVAIDLLSKVRDSEWIDYVSVADLKIQVLALMFEDFTLGLNKANNARKLSFETFKRSKPGALHDYAQWQAAHGCSFAGKYSNVAEFYIYLQWVAETQLESCQQQAIDLGMAVGLVRDLAVGSDRDGAEVALSGGVFSAAASIGAPPDPLAPQGQNWGLPPLNPVKLRNEAYAPFINLLRSNMEHSGALRIDHVMSLMRLWWCPYEKSGHGTYVMYPADDLFAILRLESQRQQCLVIGEDLGIVPAEVRRHLNESGIYSNLLFYFEKASADCFRGPQHYTRRSLAMLANHDVPTLAAWWNSTDLHLRHALNLIEDDSGLAVEISHRQSEKKQMLQLLESQWLLPADRFGPDQLAKEMDTTLAAALMRCIARSNAMLVSVQLEDLLLMRLPVNIPGTSIEYRNWQRKMPKNLLSIMDTESVTPMLESLRAERR